MSAEGSKAYDGGTRRFLQNVTYNDSGKYSCAAINNIGMTITEGWLTVIPPPQTTTGGTYNNLTSTFTEGYKSLEPNKVFKDNVFIIYHNLNFTKFDNLANVT